jgi:glutamate racemase
MKPGSHPPLSADAPIGVFDSGIGGLSVLRALQIELPDERFVYLADSGYAPYGERGEAYTIERAFAVTAGLREQHDIKALVIACNTATTAAIDLLRSAHGDLPLIGVEPAVKPALAGSRTRRVGVIGTRGTLASARFARLLASWSDSGTVVVQPCDGLAIAIEEEISAPGPAAANAVRALCARYIQAMGEFGSADGQIDTLVLGCTHYVFAESAIRQALGNADVALMETGQAVARQTRRLLAQRGLLRETGGAAVVLNSTGERALLEAAAARWLGLGAHAAL